MLTYLYCQQSLASNIPFPELPYTNQDRAGFFFRLYNTPLPSLHIEWLHHWLSPTGEQVSSYGRQDSDHWLRFPGFALFRISENAKEINCFPQPEVPRETIRHLLLDQVLPCCLAYYGKIMLHASAVQLAKGLLVFIGYSGSGKSTMAGNFHQFGNPVISDDSLWIKESKTAVTAVPTYIGLRLWEDSLNTLFPLEQQTIPMVHSSRKKRVSLQENELLRHKKDMPILAMFLLSPPGRVFDKKISLERLSRRETFIALLKQSFQMDVSDLKMMQCHVQRLGQIVLRLPAYRLSMPHDYNLLPLVREKILELVL